MKLENFMEIKPNMMCENYVIPHKREMNFVSTWFALKCCIWKIIPYIFIRTFISFLLSFFVRVRKLTHMDVKLFTRIWLVSYTKRRVHSEDRTYSRSYGQRDLLVGHCSFMRRSFIHIHTQTNSHIHTLTHILLSLSQAHMISFFQHIHTHTHSRTRTHTYTLSLSHSQTHTHTNILYLSQTHRLSSSPKHTHTRTLSLLQPQTHTHT